jgi:hypothetical protein
MFFWSSGCVWFAVAARVAIEIIFWIASFSITFDGSSSRISTMSLVQTVAAVRPRCGPPGGQTERARLAVSFAARSRSESEPYTDS